MEQKGPKKGKVAKVMMTFRHAFGGLVVPEFRLALLFTHNLWEGTPMVAWGLKNFFLCLEG